MQETQEILGLGRVPGVGNGNLPQYSYLGKFMDRGAWRATVHGLAEPTRQSKYTHTFSCATNIYKKVNCPPIMIKTGSEYTG